VILLLPFFLIWNVDGVKGVMPDIMTCTTEDVDGPSSDKDEIPCCSGSYMLSI